MPTTGTAAIKTTTVQPAPPEASRSLTGEFPREMGVNVVLLVDDDEGLRRPIVRSLRRRNLRVLEAGSVSEAREMVAAQTIDLIITDLGLPDGYGIDLVREWKEIDPIRPVLVLTGSQDENERIEAFSAGADDVVGKPVCMQELAKRLEVHDRMLRTNAALKLALRQADHMRMFAAEAAALLAHDLNNGLCVAASNLAYLADVDIITDDEDLGDAVLTSQRALRRMTTLVRNFVDVARSEDGELKAACATTDLRDILRNAAAIHHPRGAPSDRGVELECPERLTAWIDASLVERVIHNLLINATRYVDRGGKVRVCAAEETGARGSEVVVRVSNTGPTIPHAVRANLFEKYSRGGDRKAQTGMGLYFCRLACEAHGGTIRLIDEPEFGTTFEIRIPAGQAM